MTKRDEIARELAKELGCTATNPIAILNGALWEKAVDARTRLAEREAELAEFKKRDECVVCGGSLLPPDDLPHCLDCIVTDEIEEGLAAPRKEPRDDE